MILQFTTHEQVKLFRNCKCATSLLETRTDLEALQPVCDYALAFYNLKIQVLLIKDKISA